MTLRIWYVTHMRVPTEKAYGLQMANTVYHLAKAGADISFIGTYNPNPITQDLFSYYGIPEESFGYQEVWSSRLFRNTRVGFWLNMFTFSFSVLLRALYTPVDVVYSREPFPLLFFALIGKKTVYEMHDAPHAYLWFHRFLCRRVYAVAVTNAYAQEQCITTFRVNPRNVLLVPNGYDETKFTGLITQKDARKMVLLPEDARIVLYSGHLYAWKGVQVLLEVARAMPEALFVFVGGHAKEREALSVHGVAENVVFIPHQSPEHIPHYLAAADVLVLPNVPLTSHSEFSTSPIKLFEYLASRRPVVVSRLPSLESLVSEKEVVFAEAGDVKSWEDALTTVLENPAQYTLMVDCAAMHVRQFSWRKKAEKILTQLTS